MNPKNDITTGDGLKIGILPHAVRTGKCLYYERREINGKDLIFRVNASTGKLVYIAVSDGDKVLHRAAVMFPRNKTADAKKAAEAVISNYKTLFP